MPGPRAEPLLVPPESPILKDMSVKNAPSVPNNGGFEARVTGTPHGDKTAGSNASSAAHTFEGRVVQETGTH